MSSDLRGTGFQPHVGGASAGSSGGTGTGGGHVIVDANGNDMPQRAKLQFLGGVVLDDSPGDVTEVDIASFARPNKPSIVSPVDASTNIPILMRLTGTPYSHPLVIPMQKSHWQIAEDENFTIMVLDREQDSAAYSTVVTTDPSTQAILSINTAYYARVKYIDIRDTESAWSDVISFSTVSVAAPASILVPEIIVPIDGTHIPETRFFAQMTAPEVVGSVNVDKSDWELSMTNGFQSGDIVQDYLNESDPVRVVDNLLNLTSAPSPLYLRARQKDSAGSIVSPWSSPVTVWIQRHYTDPVIGLNIIPTANNDDSFVFYIDESGNKISIDVGYFNDHVLFATAAQDETDEYGNVMGRFLPGWVKTEGDTFNYKIWISPTDKPGFTPALAFLWDDSGFLKQKYYPDTNGISTAGGNYTSLVFTSQQGDALVTSAKNQIIAMNTSNTPGWHVENVFEFSWMRLLMTIEACGFNYATKFGSGITQSGDSGFTVSTGPNWRGFYNEYFDTTNWMGRICQGAGYGYDTTTSSTNLFLSSPYNPEDSPVQVTSYVSPIPDPGNSNSTPATNAEINFKYIHTGTIADMNDGLDYGQLLIPQAMADRPSWKTWSSVAPGPFGAFYKHSADGPRSKNNFLCMSNALNPFSLSIYNGAGNRAVYKACKRL